MRPFLPLVLVLSVVSGARAQTVIINRPPSIGSFPAQHQRVTVNVTLATPAAAGTSAGDVTNSMAAANTSLFGIVNHQCDVLGAQLNGDCRLIAITTNGGISERMPSFGSPPPSTPTISVTANATFEIDPKPSAPTP
ncbi:MAG: hypothetical protein ACRYF2_01245 [Janthinobacterium lividum]